MTSAITHSAIAAPAATRAPQPVNLDAEKARCESQLSDWVHCVSASTPEGKAKIDALSAKLATIQSNIDKADLAKKEAETAKVDAGAITQPTSTLGNHVDEFA